MRSILIFAHRNCQKYYYLQFKEKNRILGFFYLGDSRHCCVLVSDLMAFAMGSNSPLRTIIIQNETPIILDGKTTIKTNSTIVTGNVWSCQIG